MTDSTNASHSLDGDDSKTPRLPLLLTLATAVLVGVCLAHATAG